MMNDALVEIDADQMAVSRHFTLTKGSGMGAAGPVESGMKTSSDHLFADVGAADRGWQDGVGGMQQEQRHRRQMDLTSWTMWRRVPAGDGIYNLAASHDGKLIVGTNKRGKSVSSDRREERHGDRAHPDDAARAERAGDQVRTTGMRS